MSRQAVLKVTLELRSDAIFGSGYSIPGGEDIAVCQDENGYPYFRGTTFKGLLRESMSDLLDWSGAPSGTLEELFGKEEDWSGAAGERRLHFTPFTLENPPKESENCYAHRTFTSLENGVVKSGTLRAAVCICSGQCFVGELCCAEQDAAIVCDAVRGIKWVGTMRSRGFGWVSAAAEKQNLPEKSSAVVGAAHCLHYTLHTEAPVSMTDYNRSGEHSWDTHGYISGSAVRGLAAGTLAQQDPDWFAANKAVLLSDKVRFLNAMPVINEKSAVIPSIKGFYERKDGSAFESVVIKGEFASGSKRADVGSFCTLEGETLCYWNAKTGGSLRIQRRRENKDPQMFQTRSIDAGQTFEGYILLDDASLAPKLAEVLCGTVWLGADRYDGMGKCQAEIEACDAPAYHIYGSEKSAPGDTVFYLLALSPLCMTGEYGEPCGIAWKALAEKLGVSEIKCKRCSTSVSEYGGFNRKWGCHTAAVRMYDAGSLFRIECSSPPDKERLAAVERSGLGLRRAEGFGQVLLLPGTLVISSKKAEEQNDADAPVRHEAAELRRQRLTWIMQQCKDGFAGGISRSQLGDIQALCESSLSEPETVMNKLNPYFEKQESKGAKVQSRFGTIRRFMESVLNEPTKDWIAGMSKRDRIQLLCDLFDHSRKEGARDDNVR